MNYFSVILGPEIAMVTQILIKCPSSGTVSCSFFWIDNGVGLFALDLYEVIMDLAFVLIENNPIRFCVKLTHFYKIVQKNRNLKLAVVQES